jgi:hypothetical protein
MFVAREILPAIVLLEFSGGMSVADEAAYLDSLDRLSMREAPFVVVALMDGRTPLSPDGRRQQALWFKRSREHLRAWCRGLVRVPRGDARSDFGDEALARALPFPFVHAADQAEAVAIAERLLASR